MSFYQWNDRMSVGIPLIDTDHRKLIGLIDDLHGAVADGTTARLAAVLDALIAYTEYHFAREETVMAACGFPGIAIHAGEHAEFTWRMADWRGASRPDPALAPRLLDYLKSWLTVHILIQDKAYEPYARGNADADRAARAFGTAPGEKRQPAPIVPR